MSKVLLFKKWKDEVGRKAATSIRCRQTFHAATRAASIVANGAQNDLPLVNRLMIMIESSIAISGDYEEIHRKEIASHPKFGPAWKKIMEGLHDLSPLTYGVLDEDEIRKLMKDMGK